MREVTLVPPKYVTMLIGIEKITRWKGQVTVHYADGSRKSARLPGIAFDSNADVVAIAQRVESAQRVTA